MRCTRQRASFRIFLTYNDVIAINAFPGDFGEDGRPTLQIVSRGRRIYYVFITLGGARGRDKCLRCISRTFREH